MFVTMFQRIVAVCALGLAVPAAAQQVQPVPGPATQAPTRPTTPVAPAGAPGAAPAAAAGTPANVSLQDGYIIGVGDTLEVAVLGRPEFTPRIQVQNDGTIQLPYLKSVPAVDKTLLQLREDVRKRLQSGGYYTDPVVAVSVVSYSARYVTVLGEVGSPGLLPVDRAYRMSEVLAKVGGVRTTGEDVVQLRRADGNEVKLSVEEVASGGPDKDPFVNPGDKIYIATAPTFYIYGQISAPGSYKVDNEMTLRKAVARAGGLTDRGSEKKIKLFRDGKEINRYSLSDPIQGGDTLVVGERFF